MSEGRFVLAATPIGNPQDASPRLAELLATADVIAAEDTRRARRLFADLGVTPVGRVISHHEHNERARADDLVAAVEEGSVVAVITDAGMPSVSDPGLRVVRAAVERGLPVTVVPGPSAVLTALAVSGLPSDRFCFEGFPPRKEGERRRTFAALAAEPRTLIFFEAPHRLADTLADLAATFGADRPAAVCRELTKTYEEVVRRPLGDLATWAGAGPVKGEICIVVGGSPPREADPREALDGVRERVERGERLKDAVAAEAATSGLGKRELYELALRDRG